MATRKKSEPDEDNIGLRLANFLAGRRDKIIKEWTASVRRDHKVESAKRVGSSELKDHVPVLLDHLGQTLAQTFQHTIDEDAAWVAAAHGKIRWKQNFDIGEVLCEFAHLREVLIHEFTEFQRRNPECGRAHLLLEIIVLHRFIDDSMRISTKQYLAISERSKN